MSDICPRCREPQPIPIENDLCVTCHDVVYLEACGRDDETSLSIVREYRLTACSLLNQTPTPPASP